MKTIIKYYETIIKKLSDATDDKDTVKYEIELMAAAISMIFIVVSVISIPLGILWNVSLIQVLGFSAFIMLYSFIILHIAKRETLSNSIKLHAVGILLVCILTATYFVYYDKIEVLFGFIILVLVMIANTSSKDVIFYYLLFFSVALMIFSFVYKINDTIVMDTTYYAALFIMLLFSIITSHLFKRVYRTITKAKLTERIEILSKNEEITSLYEEILASEEELKEQNEILNSYNKEINANKERLEFLAYNDPLTLLPNRKKIIESIDMMIDANIGHKSPFAVVFIDLDNFKRVNDTLGHAAGDQLLIQVTHRLKSSLNPKDILGRLGGDELALIVRRNMEGEILLMYVQEICDLFSEPFELEGVASKITASFGIAVYPTDADNVDDLLKAADTAMYKAKEIGKDTVQFYDIEMKKTILQRIGLENDLIQAIINNEFYLEYQPLVCGKSNKVIEFEALIRWKTKEGKLISPAEFIPFAEENGFIIRIGEWVLHTVCEKLKQLEREGISNIKIAVNISTIHLEQDYFIDSLKQILEATQINPASLEIEITESILIQNKQKAIDKLREIRELGITISMDDFGTGYSSLSYLLELPIDKLKIDRSFIMAIEVGSVKNEIIKSIIDMVHTLNMEVVAEGIETAVQREYLEDRSCDLLQGFLLSRPLSEEKMMNLLKQGRLF